MVVLYGHSGCGNFHLRGQSGCTDLAGSFSILMDICSMIDRFYNDSYFKFLTHS